MKTVTVIFSMTLAVGFIAYRAGAVEAIFEPQNVRPVEMPIEPRATLPGSKSLVINLRAYYFEDMQPPRANSSTMTSHPLPYYPHFEYPPIPVTVPFTLSPMLPFPQNLPPSYGTVQTLPTFRPMPGSKSGTIFPPNFTWSPATGVVPKP